MEINQYRSGLKRTLKALQSGQVTVGFIGGSITDGRPGWNWPEPLAAWFAAIGATGSDLAVFRAERDLIQRGCDLVFIEFAVNDNETPPEQRMRTREGLLRKLLREAERDLILAYTFSQPMYADMLQERLPASIADFEQLAAHYAIGSVWMGLHALQEVQKGRLRWEEWLPDGLHPQLRGSLSYAQSVMSFLQHELIDHPSETAIPAGAALPAPLNPRNWENAQLLPFSEVRLEGPWLIQRWPKMVWIDQMLYTAAVGATLAFEFTGRGLMLGFDFGKNSAEFYYRLDDQNWQYSNRDRPDWCGGEGWYRTFPVADDLPPGRHTFELKVVHGNASNADAGGHYVGTTFNLALIGVIP
jgi:hypothetical protein